MRPQRKKRVRLEGWLDMISKVLISVIIAACLAGCGTLRDGRADDADRLPETWDLPEPVAADLRASDGSPAGHIQMRAGPQGLLIRIEGENWPEGWHGVHLHTVGTCEAPGFSSAGGHVNHTEAPHPHGLLNRDGGPDSGDLQNVYAHADGTARAEVYLARPAATDAAASARASGLAIIIHANADDHVSQPIGGAGPRLACAVIYPRPPDVD